MTRLPRVSGKEVMQVLQRGGFRLSHCRGSHFYWRKPDATGLVVVPVHGNRSLPIGTLRAILHQADLTLVEFLELLHH